MDFYTRQEVAKSLRVHVRTIDRWLRSGVLKGYKFGDGENAKVRIDKREVDEFLRSSRIK
ncbi:MAG: helix-turn-helix domain-containing protein [Ignavibacteriaceae bacterium]